MGIIKGTIVFGSGIYGGVYLAQNYRIPPVESPMDLFEKIRKAVVGVQTSQGQSDQGGDPTAKKDPVEAQLAQAKAYFNAFNVLFKKEPKE